MKALLAVLLLAPACLTAQTLPKAEQPEGKAFWREALAIQEPVLFLGDFHVFRAIRSELAAQMKTFREAGFTHIAFEAFDQEAKKALETLSQRHCRARLCPSCRDFQAPASRVPRNFERLLKIVEVQTRNLAALEKGARENKLPVLEPDPAPAVNAACKQDCAAKVCEDCAAAQADLCQDLKLVFDPEGDTELLYAAWEAGLTLVALEKDQRAVTEKNFDGEWRDDYSAGVLAALVKAEPKAKIAAFVGGNHARREAQPALLSRAGVASKSYMFLVPPVYEKTASDEEKRIYADIKKSGFSGRRLFIPRKDFYDAYLSIPEVLREDPKARRGD